MISVVRRKLITSDESFLTRAPITPRLVSRRYSNGLLLDVVLRNGYRKRGMCANPSQVSHRFYRGGIDDRVTYRGGTWFSCRCVMQHTEGEPGHCTLYCWQPP